ncbi:MAG: hypothetical protein NT020_11660 [Chloroflexales bacterium]|jgi:hypothetical protein|nr:hypothetical protein [Chloroflexales bacterium]
MNFLGGIVALGAGLTFAALSIIVIIGVQHTLRTRVVPRFTIMQTPARIRKASIIYVIVVAALPTTLGLLTAWQLIAMMVRIWK